MLFRANVFNSANKSINVFFFIPMLLTENFFPLSNEASSKKPTLSVSPIKSEYKILSNGG
jgi:hypothetical protein